MHFANLQFCWSVRYLPKKFQFCDATLPSAHLKTGSPNTSKRQTLPQNFTDHLLSIIICLWDPLGLGYKVGVWKHPHEIQVLLGTYIFFIHGSLNKHFTNPPHVHVAIRENPAIIPVLIRKIQSLRHKAKQAHIEPQPSKKHLAIYITLLASYAEQVNFFYLGKTDRCIYIHDNIISCTKKNLKEKNHTSAQQNGRL